MSFTRSPEGVKKVALWLSRNKFLILVVVFGVVLRLPLLSNGLWADEAVTLRIFEVNPLKNPFFIGVTPDPPLFLHLLRIWSVVGTKLEWLRLLPLILGMISVFFCYQIGAIIKDRRLGIIAASLAAVSPLHIYYSHELRPYPLVLAITAAMIYSWFSFLKHGRKLRSLAIIATMGLLTHYIFSIVTPIVLLIGVIFLNAKKERIRQKQLTYCLGALLVLTLIIGSKTFLLGQTVMLSGHVPKTIDWAEILLPIIKIKEVLFVYFPLGYFYRLLPNYILTAEKRLLLALVVGVTILLLRDRHREPGVFEDFLLLIGVTAVGNFVTSYAEFLTLYPYGGRHILPLLLFWLVALAILLDKILALNKLVGGVVFSLILTLLLTFSPTFDPRMSLSNGYIEATRLAIKGNYPTINFLTPDENTVRYLVTQYGEKIKVKTDAPVTTQEPTLLDKAALQKFENSDYKILYVNPEKSNFLIIKPSM